MAFAPKKIFSAVVTGTVSGSAVDMNTSGHGLAVALIATAANLTSATVLVEHSPNGTNWFLLDTFTAVTGNTTEARQISAPNFSNIRVRVSAFTGTTVTLNVFAE